MLGYNVLFYNTRSWHCMLSYCFICVLSLSPLLLGKVSTLLTQCAMTISIFDKLVLKHLPAPLLASRTIKKSMPAVSCLSIQKVCLRLTER